MKHFRHTAALLFTLPTLGFAQAEHLVIKGDTLISLSRHHSCTVDELRTLNGLKGDLILAGQMLRLPAKSAPATKPIQPSLATKDSRTAHPLADAFTTLNASEVWKIQIHLDTMQFAPGKVDGMCGQFTYQAAERWISAAPGRDFSTLVKIATTKVKTTHRSSLVPTQAMKWIGPLHTNLREKSAATALPYESLAELMAERFHTDLATLYRLNPSLDLTALKPGDSLNVPAVTPFLIESWPPTALSAAQEGIHLRICHDERVLEVLDATNRLIACYPITVSSKPEHRRTGGWRITTLAANPSFLWDEVLLKEGRPGPVQHLLPPGPNNPVGVLWMKLSPDSGAKSHIGIHGTDDPARIGRSHSSGCIRLANWDVVRLARLAGKGTAVAWSDSTSPPVLVSAD